MKQNTRGSSETQIMAEIERVTGIIIDSAEDKLREMPKQPVKSVIVAMIGQLQHILFPGVFEGANISKNALHNASYKNRISVMLEEIYNDLCVQISLALRYDLKYKDIGQNEIEEEAAKITHQFISKIPEIKEKLDTDIEAAYNGDPAAYSKAEIIVSYPGIYAGMVHRIAHELYLLSVPLIPRIMSEYAHNVTGIDIHPGAVIGKYFFMDHGTGIVIGETTIIGNNVKLYQGVTLGALSTKGGQSIKGVKRHPTIHDNVTVYSGASILGGDTVIGEGVVIGGNAFVVRSIPEKTRVSVKNPELQYKNNNISTHLELDQKEFWYYEI
ncbi:MAG: serine acetyltransferase [Treponema sp.]|nr:serine acetyltransferase [Treponema sp.]MCL2251485.1 serine acetyltransferase [Treponema sp.]